MNECEKLLKELNTLKEGYRVSYKWWIFHVYKVYDDGREHHVGEFAGYKQVREFLEGEGE